MLLVSMTVGLQAQGVQAVVPQPMAAQMPAGVATMPGANGLVYMAAPAPHPAGAQPIVAQHPRYHGECVSMSVHNTMARMGWSCKPSHSACSSCQLPML